MAGEKRYYSDDSRKDWYATLDGVPIAPSTEHLQFGCLQRIANSLEKMERPFRDLIDDNTSLRERNAKLEERVKHLKNTIRAHKANFTRLKVKNSK